MPITPLPPTNTERWWLDYTVNGDAHSMLMRTVLGIDPAVVSDGYADFLEAMGVGALYGINVTGLRRAVIGSDVTLPQLYTGSTPIGSGTGVAGDDRAKVFSFTGRDVSGHKARVFVYGAKVSADGDYRFDLSENADVIAGLTQLKATVDMFLSINGLPVVWNDYVNIGYNDHWIKQARG